MSRAHFVGVSGAFMAGLAKLAMESGWAVSGSDAAFHPPMGDAVRALGVPLFSGYDADCDARPADLYVVGNAVSRGNPLVESVLRKRRPMTSGPQFLHDNILRGRKVLAVAGTHGKTTTTALLVHILEAAGLAPGFLAGGVLPSFNASARLSDSEWFVAEADEYDSAFFDKRPKFMHCRPRGAILNNLEFDHADIYANVDEIIRQFHHLLRTIPDDGKILARAGDANLARALDLGAYSPTEFFGESKSASAEWQWRMRDGAMEVLHRGTVRSCFAPPLPGAMNRRNTLAALALADWAGAKVEDAEKHLRNFIAPLRRLQLLGEVAGVRIYDDFAHHPTAYAETIRALREEHPQRRIIAVFEPRSNTMKAGIFHDEIGTALADADVAIGCGSGLGWSLPESLRVLKGKGIVVADSAAALARILELAREGDSILLMSNGDFGGLPGRVLQGLKLKTPR